MPEPTPSPADPSDAWTGDRVARWLQLAPGLERQLAPVSRLLFDAAAVQAGEAVLDVGCGTGPTTREAAARCGPGGRVTGLDISPDMLAAARGAAAEGAPIEWVAADAVTWEPPVASFDVVLSRFGVMFFDDPDRACANIAAAARPGGRLAFAVWGARTESELFELPYRVAMHVRRSRGERVEEIPPGDGASSWHDADAVTARLTGAGWRDVAVTPHTLALRFGGGLPPREAAVVARDFGPARMVLEDAPDATVDAVVDALEAEFAQHVDAGGEVVLDAAVRVITAAR